MIQASGVIICLGYILGLLFSALPGGGFWVLGLGIIGAILLRVVANTNAFKRGRNFARRVSQSKEKGLTKSKESPLTRVYPHPRIW
ncbi:hypothetical protein, partial [Brunnivagina elsteri]